MYFPARGHATAPFACLLFVLLVSCADKEVTLPQSDSAAASSAPEIPLRDAAIDVNDSHYSVMLTTRTTTTLTLSDPILDPRTGRETSTFVYRAAPDVRQVEAGYGAGGKLRFSVYRDIQDDSRRDAPTLIRAVGDEVTMSGGAGRDQITRGFEEMSQGLGVPNSTLENASVAGVLVVDSAALALRQPPAGVREPPSHREIRHVGPDAAEVIVEAPANALVPPGRSVRRYRKSVQVDLASGRRNVRWVLSEIEQTLRNQGSQGAMEIHTVTRLENLRFHSNLANDSARHHARETRRSRSFTSASSSLAPSGLRPGELNRAMVLSPSPSPPQCASGSANHNYSASTTGPNILFQHGICSDATTWDGMRPSVTSDFQIKTVQAYSLLSTDGLQSQTHSLASKVGAGANIVIGHSQGGLIARRLGQQRPDLVSGVVTIGSPHSGALIANLGPAHVASRIRGAIEGQYCAAGYMCDLLTIALRETLKAKITYGAFDADYPVRHDNKPGSIFLNNLNNQYEPFRRASIENSVPQRWAFFRLVGDAISIRTNVQYDIRPQGQTWVNRAEDLYWAGWFLYDLGVQIRYATDPWNGGYSCYGYYYVPTYGTPPCYDQYDTYFGDYYNYAYQSYWDAIADFLMSLGSQITGILDYVDWTWTDMTTQGSATTDGFIQFSSQQYPTTPGAEVPLSYKIYNSDSHTGETASPFVKQRLFIVLDQWGVIRR